MVDEDRTTASAPSTSATTRSCSCARSTGLGSFVDRAAGAPSLFQVNDEQVATTLVDARGRRPHAPDRAHRRARRRHLPRRPRRGRRRASTPPRWPPPCPPRPRTPTPGDDRSASRSSRARSRRSAATGGREAAAAAAEALVGETRSRSRPSAGDPHDRARRAAHLGDARPASPTAPWPSTSTPPRWRRRPPWRLRRHRRAARSTPPSPSRAACR